MLFHYNGHGVPRPTANGEVWVFNKSYTQYIPLSVFDLQARARCSQTLCSPCIWSKDMFSHARAVNSLVVVRRGLVLLAVAEQCSS